MNKCKTIFLILIIFLFSNILLSCNVEGCKDIVAIGDATAGDYNLLLKVRDPSRPGLQVLCIVPAEYEYTYHYPWNGKPMNFETKHKFIGVATLGDTIPNIVKAGMSLSASGIAYGDADTASNWINPTKNAWDDFDWIRYACQQADDEQEAASLMTKDCVDKLHATGASENLFIVGPKEAFVVEADAFRYNVKEIDDILVMSNYPKALWRTQVHRCLPIASSFDIIKEKYVRKGMVLRLNSFYGIRIVDIGENWVIVRQAPFLKISYGKISKAGEPIKINLEERKTVCDFSVELLDINDNKAKIKVCYIFKAWENKMMDYVKSRYGSITVKDMMNWSRLHREDLDGLRPMCEGTYKYEATAIYKIPEANYDMMSNGWFSANHACSSIYIPFHICDTEIYDPYENGEAAELSIELLNKYEHATLIPYISKVEDVFLVENELIEKLAEDLIENNQADIATNLLTISDVGMQRQAWLTEQLWMEVGNISNQTTRQEIMNIIDNVWDKNYTLSLEEIETGIYALSNISGSESIVRKLEDIKLDICKSRIDVSNIIIEKQHFF
jgi:hypothetical protein